MGLRDKLKGAAGVGVALAALCSSQGCNIKKVKPPVFTREGAVRLYTEHEQIYLKDPESCALQLAKYAQSSQSSLEEGMAILGSEIKRGWLSPARAQKAKKLLEEGLVDYDNYVAISRYIHGSDPEFRFKIDFSGPVIKQEIFRKRVPAKKAPYPKEITQQFDSFTKKYCGKDRKYLKRAISELQETISREKQTQIKPHRYLPFIGKNEAIDELVNPNNDADNTEGVLVILPLIMIAIGGIFYFVVKQEIKREQEAERKKSVPTLEVSGDKKEEVKVEKKKESFPNPFDVKIPKEGEK